MSRDLLSAVDKVSVEVKPASPKTNANVLLEVFREGKLITRREKHNLVVNSGKADMAARLLVTPSTLYQFMRLGYNGVTASSAQTQITTVIASSQMACNTAAMSGARTAKLGHTWTGGDFSASGICEAGIFDLISGAGSKMLARVTFTAVAKDSSSTLKITWTIKIN